MFEILKKISILQKKSDNTGNDNETLAKHCSYLAIGLNLFLVGMKVLCGLASGSVSILADGINNLTDVLVAVMTWIGFKIAGIGAGKNHPFGHGRFEWIMGAASGVMILFIGAQSFLDSIKAIRTPNKVEFNLVVAAILLVSIAAKFFMYCYDKKVSKQINSVSLMAAAEDSKNDTLSTSMIFIGMIVQLVAGVNIDGWCGLAVSVLIMIGGLKTIDEAVERILGMSPNTELVNKIKAIVEEYPVVHMINKLNVHDYGMGHIAVSMHIEGTRDSEILLLTRAAHEIEYRMYQELGCDTTIQVDIIDTYQESEDEVKSIANKTFEELNATSYVKELTMIPRAKGTDVVMSIVCDHMEQKKEKDILEKIKEEVRKLYPEYRVIIYFSIEVLKHTHFLKKKSVNC